MNKRIVPAICMLALCAPLLAQDRPPNIVMILGDDLGYGDVGFNGRREWATPNIDRIAKEGTILRRFYTSSVVCAPARAALMTGRVGIHNGVTGNGSLDLPAEEVTVAELLKKRGYATALFGKWHAGPPRPGNKTYTHPMDQGFDEFFGFTNARHAHQKFPAELFDGREKKPSKGYADALFTDRAVDFIGRRKDGPFFLYLPYTASHSAVEAPAEDVAEHKGKFTEKDDAKPVNAAYAAMVTRLDKEVGRVMKALTDAGVADNTMLVFSSDHGATFEVLQRGAAVYHDSNRPFRGQKRTLWEGGTRVPTFVRWPGKVAAGKEIHEALAMIDLLPTFCAAASAEVPSDLKLDGLNVLGVLRGSEKVPDRTLFWEWREGGNTQLAAMRGNMKLVINGGNAPELYDVEADPAERLNRAADRGPLAKELRAELDAWLATESDAAKERRKKDVKEE
ncbi:MAG: sulfatase-like hydrolase/transferase [Planctomycetota bacterium]|nr:sulfatase-like hydrolase/transferase [Planctomycetota bacterium]